MPGGGDCVSTSLALSPASVKRSPTWTSGPATVTLVLSVDSARLGAAMAKAAANNKATRNFMIPLLDLVERRHHLVGSLDHLRVHFVGSLRRDQIGNLGNDIDIRGFKKTLLDRAKRRRSRIAGDGRS